MNSMKSESRRPGVARRLVVRAAFVALLLAPDAAVRSEDAWKPAPFRLKTRWADDVTPANVHPEYPRPQMTRPAWASLNGVWQFTPGKAQASSAWRPLLAPFPIESALSGIGERHERFVCRRAFEVPPQWAGQRVLLHFGAVDWEARVALNGRELGVHRGGFDPFTFEITDFLRAGSQELTVEVFDPTTDGTQPHGKQTTRPEGIWYTPSSGIWQTVWIEPVPRAYLVGLKLKPDVDGERLIVEAEAAGAPADARVMLVARTGDEEISRTGGKLGVPIVLPVPSPRLWSPGDPFLYDLVATLIIPRGEQEVDEVRSYFGMRKIELGKVDGVTRILLNGEYVFQVGPLDQGFWPDGLFTAPTDAALRYDLELTRQLGFNAMRKHVKVEPARWYYWCDKLGLLVWQDMPHAHQAAKEPAVFERELRRMVEHLGNHPSIVQWVVFNEGWGQHDTERYTRLVKELDPSRLVCCASGWHDKPVGDVIDMHRYPGPGAPQWEAERAAVLGEFGGLGLAVKGHLWDEKTWSYQGTGSSEQLTYAYETLLREVWRLEREAGLSAAIYTQITDVETEINGLATYDRAVVKIDVARAAAANRGQFAPERVIVPTAREEAVAWRYALESPSDDWTQPEFDDGAWPQGRGGFGAQGTPGAVIGTEWKTGDIWLRREFELEAMPREPVLVIHHDEDVEVFLNGVPAAKADGYTTNYWRLPISAEARAALRSGRNVLAVHCKQTAGGQYIDCGIAEREEK